MFLSFVLSLRKVRERKNQNTAEGNKKNNLKVFFVIRAFQYKKHLPGVYTERNNTERSFFRKSNLIVQLKQNQMKTKLSRSSGLATAFHFSFETEQDCGNRH